MDLRDIWRGGPVEVAHVARRTAGLRAGSRIYSRLEMDEAWSSEMHMLAHAVDAVHSLEDTLLRVNVDEKAQGKLTAPEPIPRPALAARLAREEAAREARRVRSLSTIAQQYAEKVKSGEGWTPDG